MRPDHWIVIPCYNEAARLPVETLRTWLPANPSFGFLFVNDGSTDDTARVIDDFAKSMPDQTTTLHLAENAGKAEAVRRGLLRAIDRAPATIGYFDADLATPLDELPRLLDVLQSSHADMAIGARVQLLGRDIKRKARRHYLGRIFATAASMTLGLAIYDTQCGAKLIRGAPWTRSILDRPFLSRWVFDVELIARYLADVRHAPRWPTEPCGIVEVPLTRWHDVGDSKVRVRDFLRAALDLVTIARHHSRRQPVSDASRSSSSEAG